MLVGYARVSPLDPISALQRQCGELRAAGAVGHIYAEQVSAAAPERAELAACLAALGDGDTLVVTRPDRLGTLAQFVTIYATLQRRGVGVFVLSWRLDSWDRLDHTVKLSLRRWGVWLPGSARLRQRSPARQQQPTNTGSAGVRFRRARRPRFCGCMMLALALAGSRGGWGSGGPACGVL